MSTNQSIQQQCAIKLTLIMAHAHSHDIWKDTKQIQQTCCLLAGERWGRGGVWWKAFSFFILYSFLTALSARHSSFTVMTQWSGVHQAPTRRCKKYHRSCLINTLWSESACWGKIMPPRAETLSESISVWRAVLGAAGICWVAEAHALARRAFVLSF